MTKRGIPKNDLKKYLHAHGFHLVRKNGMWMISKGREQVKSLETLREVFDFALELDEAVKKPENNEATGEEEVQDAEG